MVVAEGTGEGVWRMGPETDMEVMLMGVLVSQRRLPGMLVDDAVEKSRMLLVLGPLSAPCCVALPEPAVDAWLAPCH